MQKCLMLDVDGVLISGRPTDGRAWTTSLWDDLGIDINALIHHFFSTEWQDVVTGKQELFPALTASLAKIPTSVSAEDLISYWFEMDSRIVDSVLSDCRDARSKGISVYLSTNQEHRRAAYLMDTLGLRSEVDGIVYSAQAGVQKPHFDFYRFAANATGRHAKELLLVDDTLQNVEGAIKAGWNAVHWIEGMKLADILHLDVSP